MLQTVKTLRHEGQNAPEKIEIDTPFSIGQMLNVEYDLPRKLQWSAYSRAIEVSPGKALGVFKITDIYRNMLVNPNFTMIELTSRDETFDKLYINDKTFLIEEDVLLKRHKTFSRDMTVDDVIVDASRRSEMISSDKTTERDYVKE